MTENSLTNASRDYAHPPYWNAKFTLEKKFTYLSKTSQIKLWHLSTIGIQRNTLIPIADIRENHSSNITPDITPSIDNKNAENRYRKDPRNE
jgi:hypothetical protein